MPFIDDIDENSPAGSARISTVDDEIRALKQIIKDTFPNLDAAVTRTPAQLNSSGVPIGFVSNWYGLATQIPDGWVLCDGRQLVRADYPELFTALGTTHNRTTDTDNLNFRVPNLHGTVHVNNTETSGLGTRYHNDTLTMPEATIESTYTPEGTVAITIPEHRHGINITSGTTTHYHRSYPEDKHFPGGSVYRTNWATNLGSTPAPTGAGRLEGRNYYHQEGVPSSVNPSTYGASPSASQHIHDLINKFTDNTEITATAALTGTEATTTVHLENVKSLVIIRAS